MNIKKYYQIILIIIIAAFALAAPVNLLGKSTFSGERLNKECLNYVRKYLGENTEIKVLQKINDQTFDEPGVTARCSGNPETFRGLCNVSVEFTKEQQLLKRIEVSLRVRIYYQVAVAKRSLQAGTIIKKQDIVYQKMEVTKFADSELPFEEEIIGAAVKRTIPKSVVITRQSLGNAKLIKRGEKITVVALAGAVKIRTNGYAMHDASIGEMIKFKCKGKILQGQLAADGTVILSYNKLSFK